MDLKSPENNETQFENEILEEADILEKKSLTDNKGPLDNYLEENIVSQFKC